MSDNAPKREYNTRLKARRQRDREKAAPVVPPTSDDAPRDGLSRSLLPTPISCKTVFQLLLGLGAFLFACAGVLVWATHSGGDNHTRQFAATFADFDVWDLEVCHLTAAIRKYKDTGEGTTLYAMLQMQFQPNAQTVFARNSASSPPQAANNNNNRGSWSSCPAANGHGWILTSPPADWQVRRAAECVIGGEAQVKRREEMARRSELGLDELYANDDDKRVFLTTQVVGLLAGSDEGPRVRYHRGLAQRKWARCLPTLSDTAEALTWKKAGGGDEGQGGGVGGGWAWRLALVAVACWVCAFLIFKICG